MSFIRRERPDSRPELNEYYFSSVLASMIVFLAVVAVFVGSALLEGNADIAAALFIFGLFASILVGLPMSLFLTGPIGTAIAFALSRFAPEGRWHGPLSGLLTGCITVLAYALALDRSDFPSHRVEYLAILAFLTVGAIAGWIAQAKILAWPHSTP